MSERPKDVITWQAPSGAKIDICQPCERKLAGNWPKTRDGEEYCTVSYGLHQGFCDICQKEE